MKRPNQLVLIAIWQFLTVLPMLYFLLMYVGLAAGQISATDWIGLLFWVYGAAFTPSDAPRPRWRLAAIGKINYHWQHKGLHFVVDIMRQLTRQFECWIVGQGKGVADFRHSLGSEIVSSLRWCPFVPPWEMPHLLNQLDGIFIFESGLPHPVASNLALEAICSGVGIITDRTDFAETYLDIVKIDKNQVMVVSPSESSSVAEMISQWVEDRAHIEQQPHQLISYQEYLSANESTYTNLLNGSQS